jgi:hypothetical protein
VGGQLVDTAAAADKTRTIVKKLEKKKRGRTAGNASVACLLFKLILKFRKKRRTLYLDSFLSLLSSLAVAVA